MLNKISGSLTDCTKKQNKPANRKKITNSKPLELAIIVKQTNEINYDQKKNKNQKHAFPKDGKVNHPRYFY